MFDSDDESYDFTLTGKTKRFALNAIKTRISNKNVYDTYWISVK